MSITPRNFVDSPFLDRRGFSLKFKVFFGPILIIYLFFLASLAQFFFSLIIGSGLHTYFKWGVVIPASFLSAVLTALIVEVMRPELAEYEKSTRAAVSVAFACSSGLLILGALFEGEEALSLSFLVFIATPFLVSFTEIIRGRLVKKRG